MDNILRELFQAWLSSGSNRHLQALIHHLEKIDLSSVIAQELRDKILEIASLILEGMRKGVRDILVKFIEDLIKELDEPTLEDFYGAKNGTPVDVIPGIGKLLTGMLNDIGIHFVEELDSAIQQIEDLLGPVYRTRIERAFKAWRQE